MWIARVTDKLGYQEFAECEIPAVRVSQQKYEGLASRIQSEQTSQLRLRFSNLQLRISCSIAT